MNKDDGLHPKSSKTPAMKGEMMAPSRPIPIAQPIAVVRISEG